MYKMIPSFQRWVLLVGFLVVPLFSYGVLMDLTLEDLTVNSDWVVIGTVENMESRWNDAHDYIYTYLTLSVDEYLKNPLDETELTIQIPGGVVDDIEQKVSDTPEFEIGELVVLFLFDREGQKWVYGWEKGKYSVGNGQIAELGTSLSTFKEQINGILQHGVDHE